MNIAVACSARRQGSGTDDGHGWVVFGPDKAELNLLFVRSKANRDDFIWVNRAATRFPNPLAKKLKHTLWSDDGDRRSVLVFWAPCAVCSVRVWAVFWP